MAPITSFLSEEAYSFLPGAKKESVFLESFENLHQWHNPKLNKKFHSLLEVRQTATKEIEALRQEKKIGSSLEVYLQLTLPQPLYLLFKDYPFNEELFIVSKVDIFQGDTLKISVNKVPGEKCCRCWWYSKHLNTDQLCPKCIKNLDL